MTVADLWISLLVIFLCGIGIGTLGTYTFFRWREDRLDEHTIRRYRRGQVFRS